MQFPSQLFKDAGLTATDIGNLCGVSRITGFRWLQGINRKTGQEGVGVNVLLRERVAKVTEGVRAAVDAGALPNTEIAKLPPKKRASQIRAIINQHRQQK